mmetsp:Transcript_24276/g.52844  ORF Transcript_24276/g.52844 Transcript_24276/m.52844 type:complete len:298 (+) Transcript_24276:124-1017(+)
MDSSSPGLDDRDLPAHDRQVLARWVFATYNCQSAKATNRLDDMDRAFHHHGAAVVFLQGHRRSRTLPPDAPLQAERTCTRHYYWYMVGLDRPPHHHPHAGVGIAIARRRFRDCQVRQVLLPPRENGDRAMALRVRHGEADWLLVSAYLPVSSQHGDADGREEVATNLLGWIAGCIAQQPRRVVPILGMDADAHLPSGPNELGCVGPQGYREGNRQGALVLDFLRENQLAAVATWWSTAPTFWGNRGTSWVDQLVVPTALLPCVRRTWTNVAAGDSVQLAIIGRRLDPMGSWSCSSSS